MSLKFRQREKPIACTLTLKKRLRLWRADYQWIALGIAGLLIFCLGYYGFERHYANEPVQRTFFDLVSLTLQLFRINSVVPPGPKPWQLEAARTLATVVTFVAGAKAFMLLFRDRLQGLRLARFKDHIIICGLGKKGSQLAEDLIKQGERIVIIEKNDGNDEIESFRGKGAIVLIGNATSLSILHNAKIRRARYVFVVGGDDKINLEIALLAHQLMNQGTGGDCGALQVIGASHPTAEAAASELPDHLPFSRCCFVHLIDLELRDLLTQQRVFSGSAGRGSLRGFNICENSARSFFLNHPPDAVAKKIGQDEVHLVIIGFGNMGQSVALQAARVGHYAHDKTIRITVIDKQVRKREQLFFHNYQNFTKICEISFIDLDIDDVSFLNGSFLKEHGGPETVTEAIVCLEQEAAGLVCGLHLAKLFKGSNSPIFIRMNVETGLIALLQSDMAQRLQVGEIQQILYPFGCIASCCSSEMVINEEQDRMAREIHAGYMRVNLAKNQLTANKLNMQKWHELAEDFKESNRQQTEHIDIKLRTIGCYRRPRTSSDTSVFTFTPQEIELLAQMEHARWNAERWLSGWNYREGLQNSDPVHKLSPYLVAWQQLGDEIKQYDRNAVFGIPAILAQINQEVVRVDDSAHFAWKQ